VILYTQERERSQKGVSYSATAAAAAASNSILGGENKKKQRSSDLEFKAKGKKDSWKRKSQWYHNCFRFLLSTFNLILPAPPSLEEESKRKRSQFSSKRTPKNTRRRPTRPLIPRMRARPLISPVSVAIGKREVTAFSPG
jgi:hypothetical protein